MRKQIVSLGLAAVMAASLAACSSSSSETTAAAAADSQEAAGTEAAEGGDAQAAEGEAADGAVFKIGGIGPITGDAAVYGIAVQRGAELAVEEINAAGGINGYPIEFQFQDDENDPEKSVRDKSMEDNMFQITPSGSAVECAANPNVFRICFSDPDQGTAAATYIGEHDLATKVAVIYDSSSVYSSGIYENFAQEAQNQGIEIVSAEAFTADSNKDFSTQLQKAKDNGAELVFLPIYYTEASLILQQANTMGYAPQFFGCDGMDGILNVENFDTSLAEGLMLLTPFAADATDDLTVNFVTSYEEAYGETPIQFAADSYDAIYALKAAIEDAGATPDMSVSDLCEAVKASMLNITLDGLTGSGMTWTEDGEPHKEPKAVMVENGAYTAME